MNSWLDFKSTIEGLGKNQEALIFLESLNLFLADYPLLSPEIQVSNKIWINLVSKDFPDWYGFGLMSLFEDNNQVKIDIYNQKFKIKDKIEKNVNILRMKSYIVYKYHEAIKTTKNYLICQNIIKDLPLPIWEEICSEYSGIFNPEFFFWFNKILEKYEQNVFIMFENKVIFYLWKYNRREKFRIKFKDLYSEETFKELDRLIYIRFKHPGRCFMVDGLLKIMDFTM